MFEWLTYPIVDPVALSIGPLEIRWYGIAYVAGILLGRLYLISISKRYPNPDWPINLMDDLLLWLMAGVMIGGRLGYVLFYEPLKYFKNPLEIFMIWEGGMAFHGGLCGVIVAVVLYTRYNHLSVLRVLDLLAVGTPIGLFFGRIANFINGELYGRVTDKTWGIVFPHVDLLPRHPSQLYEALLEGIVLFVVLRIAVMRLEIRTTPGRLTGLFGLGYGLSRTLVETVREPDLNIGYLVGGTTWGQWLSLPLVIGGLYLLCRPLKHNRSNTHLMH